MLRKIVFVALLAFTAVNLTACFYSSSSSNQPAATTCDPSDPNCHSYKSSWGFFF
jgi:hypothetical protein